MREHGEEKSVKELDYGRFIQLLSGKPGDS